MGQQAQYQNSYFTFVRNFTTNTPINQFAAFTGSNGVLIPYYQPSLDGYANDSLLGAFMDTWSPARTLLNGTTSAQVQLNVVYDNATVPFLEQYIDNVDGGNLKSVYDGLAAIPSLTLPYYLRRWELVTNTTAIVRTIYENVLKGRSLYLSAHHLYGSSRLGTKDYLPGQYRMDWDYTGPTVIADTAGLMARRPWYSLEYNDNISGLALQPYSMADMSAYLLSHQIGQKQYELTNHLGNVQATISDYPYLRPVGEGDTIRQRNPALVTAYDYYPFGMLMPGRGTDSILGISNVNGNILIESNFSDGTLQGWIPWTAAPLSNDNQRLKVNILTNFRGARKDMAVIPGRQYRLRLRIDRGTYGGSFRATLIRTAAWTVIQSTSITQPITDLSINFTPTVNMVSLVGESSGLSGPVDQNLFFDNFVLEEVKQQGPVAPVGNGGCITMTQTKWVTTYEDYCYGVYNWVWPFYQVVNGGVASVLTGSPDVRIEAASASANVSFQFDVLPNVPQELSADITSVTTGGGNLQVSELVNGSWVTLNQKTVTAKGSLGMNFTPTTTSIKLTFTGPLLIRVGTVCIKKPVLKQENILVDICPDADDRYRFGFNGQEKVNEWAGIGNFMDYKERGQDTRIARFTSRDQMAPKFPMLSPYQFASNTPIQAIDLDGNEAVQYNVVEWRNSDGETIENVTTKYDVASPKYGNEGVLITYWNTTTGVMREDYQPETTIIYKATAYDLWWKNFQFAARNDFQGKAGYDAVGKHIVPVFTNTLGLLFGAAELKAAWQAKNWLQVALATTDVAITTDDLLGGGSSATPLERVLSNEGKIGLNALKTLMAGRGVFQGVKDVGKGLKGREAEELGINIFKTGEAAGDVIEKGGNVKDGVDKFGMQKIDVGDEKGGGR